MKINKKIIILLGVFLVLLVSITAILTRDKKLNIVDYDKYLLSVIISTKSTEEASHTINVYSDKKNITIDINSVDGESIKLVSEIFEYNDVLEKENDLVIEVPNTFSYGSLHFSINNLFILIGLILMRKRKYENN